jgi:hypothetical protein
MLKIIVFEENSASPDPEFSSDEFVIIQFLLKTLADSPDTKIFAFEQHKDSSLLWGIKEEVPQIPILFIDEASLSDEPTKKDASNVICGFLYSGFGITRVEMDRDVDVDFDSKYSAPEYPRIKKLAWHINDLE